MRKIGGVLNEPHTPTLSTFSKLNLRDFHTDKQGENYDTRRNEEIFWTK